MRFLIMFLWAMGLFSCHPQEPLGGKSNPIKIAFVPSVDAQTVLSSSSHLAEFLEKETGLFFEVVIPTNYLSVIEAFGSQRADIGVINSLSYLKAHKKYGAQAFLKVIRHGQDFYRGQIIARADSGIQSLQDLHGKTFAYADPSSTSGHLLPRKMFESQKITPSQTTFAMKHDNVVAMVYQGQVDAGATFYSPPWPNGDIGDARQRVKTQFPDVEEKVKIVALTEKIPNDPFVARKDLPKEILQKFTQTLKKYILTPQGRESLKAMYSFDNVTVASDQDYDRLRVIVQSLSSDLLKNSSD